VKAFALKEEKVFEVKIGIDMRKEWDCESVILPSEENNQKRNQILQKNAFRGKKCET
jgi:hypothetical protein